MNKNGREVRSVSTTKKLALKFRGVFLGIAALVSVFGLSAAHVAVAAPVDNPETTNCDEATDPFCLGTVKDETVLSTTEDSAQTVIVRLINLALTFLGLISVVLILWGGFRWMTAGGNDEQVGEAKKIIIAAVIGLAIIISAYAIANFFIGSIKGAVGDTTNGS